MIRRSGAVLVGLLSVSAFGLGWLSATRTHRSTESSGGPSTNAGHFISPLITERLTFAQSSRWTSATVGSGPAAESISALALPERTAAILQSVPFAELKATYLERQDSEFKKVSERYPSPDSAEADYPETIAARSRGLSLALEEHEHFITTGDWVLRSGKRVGFKAFVQYYSAVTSTPKEAMDALARKGGEVCWLTRIYFRLDGKVGDLSETSSSCLPWATYRNGVPYAVLGSYSSKLLAPYYDQLAIPIPGSGLENEANPEWYDSTASHWQNLPKVRWQGVTEAAYRQFEKEASAELASQ